jgi:hypothetical protein
VAYNRALRLREAEIAHGKTASAGGGPPLSWSTAERLAYGELAAALDKTPEAVPGQAEKAFLA